MGDEFGLHEQLGESRMGDVVSRARQRQLGIGGQLDLARARAVIGDADAAHLRVVLGRHDHLGQRRHPSVAAHDLGAVLGEARGVLRRLRDRRLIGRRPDFAVLDVAQEDIASPIVAGRILAPARHRHVAPARVAGARHRQHHGEIAVRQQMRARQPAIGRGVAPPHVGHDGADLDRLGDLGRRRPRHHDVARHALLQQKLRRLHDGFGVEALAHLAVLQRIGDGDQAHRLVMRHVAAHDGDLGAFRKARRRVVHRLVPAIGAAPALVGEALEIARRMGGIDHRGERGGIGRDDDVLRQAALVAEVGHAEA